MAIADKLVYLNDTKTLLRDAIRRAGHYLPDAATFRSYPYALLPDESSLSLDFVRGEYVAHNWRDGTVSRAGLSSIMTTTRASGGGYFDHLGVYQWAANNTPRIDHDPGTLSSSTSSVTLAAGSVTLAVTVTYPVGAYVRATHDGSNWMAGRVTASTGSSVTLWVDRVVGSGTYASWTVIRVRGLLVEESRTNLLAQSDNPSASPWTRDNLGVSGNTFTETAGSAVRGVYANSPGGSNTTVYASGVAYTAVAAIRPKPGSAKRYIQIALPTPAFPANARRAKFDTETGDVTWKDDPAVIATATRIGDLCVCRITVTAATSGTGYGIAVGIDAAPTGAVAAYVGDGVSGIDLLYADLQAGAFPTSHIPTTTAQVTRAADQCTISNLTDWLGTDNTLIIDHNAPAGRVLLSSGATVLATSQGPGKLAIVFTATETRICQAGGSVTTSGPLTFDTSLRLLASASAYANAHVRVVQSIPRALTSTELQRVTA